MIKKKQSMKTNIILKIITIGILQFIHVVKKNILLKSFKYYDFLIKQELYNNYLIF